MFPDRKLLIIVIVLSSIFVADNVIKYAATPSGTYFAAYDNDELGFISAQKSYIFGFKSPWLASEDTIFHNLALGSNFVMVPFGIFYLLFNADLRIVFLVTKFLLAFGYFIVSYNVIRQFLPEKEKTDLAFLLFMLATGLGGIAYIALANIPFLHGFVSPENYIYVVGGGSIYTTSLGQLYLVISLIAGYASLLMYIKKRHKSGSLLLGLSIIAYPGFGSIFVGADFLYLLINKETRLWFFSSFLGYVPWVIVYLQKPIYFREYSGSGFTYTNPFAFLVYGGFVLLFSVYAYYRHISIYLKTKSINKDLLFMLLIGAISIITSLIPTPLTVVAPRYIHLTVLPLAIIATYGIFDLSKRYSLSPKKIVYIIVIFSLPTLLVFYFFVVSPPGVYIEKDEYNALMFLRNQPQGNVISTRWPIGSIMPYYAEKRSMLGRIFGNLEQPLIAEGEEFFEGGNVDKQMEILHKYNITYVFYGLREINASKNFDPDKLGLIKIYENNTTRLYKTVE